MKRCIKSTLFTVAIGAVTVLLCSGKPKYDYPFQDPNLPIEQRVENLISLLTPEEKVGLMMNKSI